MIALLIFLYISLYSMPEPSSATPINIVQTDNGAIYQIHRLAPHGLKVARRDVLAEESPKLDESETTENHFQVTSRPGDGNGKVADEDKKEILKPVSSDGVALVDLLRRSRRAEYSDRQYYDRRNDFDDDSDYAGHNRKSSLVGYMDDNDDFPTVVW